MKIAIVNTLPIPSGQASVNRLLSYSKGMVELGDDITVLSSACSNEKEGEVGGVKFRNLGKGGKLGLLSALEIILTTVKKERFDAVILVSNSLLLIYPLAIVCKRKGIILIQEKSEFPFVLMKKGLIRKLWASFYTSTTYKIFDGLIVMTKPLMDYFASKVKKSCKLIEVPMTVDLDRFAIEKSESPYGDYVAYCGNMAGNKDGVMNLIEAFTIALPRMLNVRLLLIGGSSNQEDWERIINTVKQTGNDNIILYGKATREEMPALLKNAKALALARPSSLQSTGGFPTKLGEYLATGNPVVVTGVGDIPQYLNATNAFVVEPDNNKAFADALTFVFSDYERAKEIGQKGQELAQTVFSSKVQSQRLYDYLKTICE